MKCVENEKYIGPPVIESSVDNKMVPLGLRVNFSLHMNNAGVFCWWCFLFSLHFKCAVFEHVCTHAVLDIWHNYSSYNQYHAAEKHKEKTHDLYCQVTFQFLA